VTIDATAAESLGIVDLGPKVSILGVGVNAIAFESAIERMLAAINDRERRRVHFCTVHMIIEATRDDTLTTRLNAADIVAPDGMPLVWVGRLRGQRMERVCGPDTMPALLDRGRAIGARHYFYGGAPGVAEELAARMIARYPGLNVVGTYCPPFRPLTADEDAEVVRLIEESGADCVWVGLGSPKQEHWLAEHRDLLTAPLLLAVGAAFDFHAGTKRRAPRLMQRTGTEWLFRLASEPRRLLGRYVRTNAMFVWLLALEGIGSLRRRSFRRSKEGR
jgi:N-acetylglucosaminyldiphosphoundecaprenol N-acetyl-beta-D-mannosaminyltransferase